MFREVYEPEEDEEPLHVLSLKRPPVVQRNSSCPPHDITRLNV